MKILNLIKNLFKIAKHLSTDDSGDFRYYTVSALGKQQKVLGFMPYGLFGSPTINSMIHLLNQQAQESNGIGIADDPKNRILKNTSAGEIGLGNFLTGDYVFFDENGDCYLQITRDLLETIGRDKTETIANDKTETITNDKTVAVGNDLTVTVGGGKSETVSGTSTSNTTGVSTMNASSFEINGNSDNLVTWADLSSILSGYWSQFNSHSHVSAGANDTTVSFDITAAKATTLKTDG